MKTIIIFLSIFALIIYAWSIPVVDEFDDSDSDNDIHITNPCPMVKCMAITEPCDNIQRRYLDVNGTKCPMCPYCASPTVESP